MAVPNSLESNQIFIALDTSAVFFICCSLSLLLSFFVYKQNLAR